MLQDLIEKTGRLEAIVEAARKGLETGDAIIDEYVSYVNKSKKSVEHFINNIFINDRESSEHARQPRKLSEFYDTKVKPHMACYNEQMRRLLEGEGATDEPAWELIAKNHLRAYEQNANNIRTMNENDRFRDEYSDKIAALITRTPFLYSLIIDE